MEAENKPQTENELEDDTGDEKNIEKYLDHPDAFWLALQTK